LGVASWSQIVMVADWGKARSCCGTAADSAIGWFSFRIYSFPR
jgi:hypothetical protein